MPTPIDVQAIVDLSVEAGNVLLSYYGKQPKITHKADQSPVTEADYASNQLITETLRKLAPDIPMISEEECCPPYEERRHWNRFWLIDPLDGTKEFIKQNGEFTVNIALIENGAPTLGVIHAPSQGFCYYASKQHGTWKQEGKEKPKRVYSRVVRKGQPLTVVISRSHPGPKLEAYLSELSLKERVRVGSSLKFAYLAEGRADVYARFSPCMEWDVAAGDCLYRYAAREGENPSPLRYNKPQLHYSSFVLGSIERPFARCE